MFDLEKAITEWKAGFTNVVSMTTENLHELEEHLRETITDLLHKGLNEEDAFLVASTRLGHPFTLEKEYSKVNTALVWQKRMLWMLGGYVGGCAFADLIAGIGSLGATAAVMTDFGGAGAAAVNIAVLAAGWTILLALIYRQAKTQHTGMGSDRISLAWGICLVVMIIFGRGLSLLGKHYHIQVTGIFDFQQWLLWSVIGSFTVHFCVLAACVALMFAFSRTQSDCAEFAS